MDLSVWISISIICLILLLFTAMQSGIFRLAKSLGRTDFSHLLQRMRIGSLLMSLTPRLRSEGVWKKYLRTLVTCSRITLVAFVFLGAYLLTEVNIPSFAEETMPRIWALSLEGFVLLFLGLSIISVFEQLALYFPGQFVAVFQLPFLLTILVLFPIAALFSPFYKLFTSRKHKKETSTSSVSEKLQDLLDDSDLGQLLEPQEKKMMFSFVNFKHRVAREIMVPRVNMFCLPLDTPLEEAAKLFSHEGYSRIPVYRETIDDIAGVILYKDVLAAFLEKSKSKPFTQLESLVKPILYTPENKKISLLLQEFRQKQLHLAIVVDEYGGTEGIITIEDILEELVGEIEDEHDLQIEELFFKLPSGEAIIDAKMSIIDIEKKLSITIPPSAEYETIGGYVFWKAGLIPSKGWRLHEEHYDLEVLSSNERSIEKIKLTPRALSH